MTVGELNRQLSDFPRDRPVTAFFDGNIRITDHTGDEVRGNAAEFGDIRAVKETKIFVLGRGFCPAAMLVIGEKR